MPTRRKNPRKKEDRVNEAGESHEEAEAAAAAVAEEGEGGGGGGGGGGEEEEEENKKTSGRNPRTSSQQGARRKRTRSAGTIAPNPKSSVSQQGAKKRNDGDDGGEASVARNPKSLPRQSGRKRSRNRDWTSGHRIRRNQDGDDEEKMSLESPIPEVRHDTKEDDDKSSMSVKRAEEVDQDDDETDIFVINRAPVLTLWVAVVAAREGFKFKEGLSFGRAIAGLLAQSKGRRLGVYEEASEAEKEERKKKRKKKEMKGIEKFSVFGMNVPGRVQSDAQIDLRLALQHGDKPIPPSPVDKYLHKSFGPKYEQAKAAMEDVANSYPAQEIGKIAYSLYQKFRPKVPDGVKGWGAKGVLDIHSMQALKRK